MWWLCILSTCIIKQIINIYTRIGPIISHPISHIHHIMYIYICIIYRIYMIYIIYNIIHISNISKQTHPPKLKNTWKKTIPGSKPRRTHRIFPGERKQHSLQYLWKFFWLEAIFKSPHNKYRWLVYLEFLVSFVKMTSFSGVKSFRSFFQWSIPPQYPTYTVLCCLVSIGNEGSKNPV